MNKLLMFIFYLFIAISIFVYQDELLFWFQQTKDSSIFLVMFIATLFALFPIIPFPIIGGIIGAMYGTFLGGFVTWVASTAASLIMFLFIRFVFQNYGLKVIHRYKKLEMITLMFERNAFITILVSRLIPFIPSIVINAYSAVSRVSFISYAVASSLGKIPAMLLFAVLGHSFVSSNQEVLFVIGIYALIILMTIYFYSRWKKSLFQQKEQNK
ncbi:TVP38/TMEM64 family protein [Anaerobacillus isosaccharinicus]|uniref:TVP38/TMEM64 family membrane protein n=1 Tax=Anaerobacillus isosaccharinicus TaxID=1532552 RepID=A0A7S7L5F4_9BACI|nr:VTT domain-containing protein [Anaerobacillus isosaccharinicus]MBA5586996.1 TVP38/TMEM64 family protein [Anaerobacillus isosaccharinicus]QOY34802.1 TVP38/TMEM64 family protein [Anaerobacillus isosaccharinicus]